MTHSSFNPNTNLEKLVFVVVLLLVCLMAARIPLDSDTWWHLSAGRETVDSGKPLLVDVFSYTRYGEVWTNHSWLAQVALFSAFKIGGFLALGLLVVVSITLAIAFMYFQAVGQPLLRAPVILLGAVVSSFVWSPRPQLFSMLLFAATGYLLYLYKAKGRDRLWLLAPIFILWSNLHGGYSLGFILLGVYIFGEIINKITGFQVNEALSWKRIRKLAVWSLVCLGAVLLNPNGVDTWLVPFRTVGVEVLQNFIDEWASPDFHNVGLQSFLWLLFATVAAMALTKKPVDRVHLSGIIIFGYLALVAKRNFAPFALFCAPVLTYYAAPLFEEWLSRGQLWLKENHLWKQTEKAGTPPDGNRLKKGINLSIAAILWFAVLVKLIFVTHPLVVQAYEQRLFPVSAVAYLKSNPIQGNMFNSYTWGGYLEWTLPEVKVFVDGRTDLFGDEILQQWISLTTADETWRDVVTEWNIRYAILEPNRPIIPVLVGNGWQERYKDEVSIILERR